MKTRDDYEDEILELANTDRITYIKSSPFWLVSIQYKNKTMIGGGITSLSAIEDLYKQIKEQKNGKTHR